MVLPTAWKMSIEPVPVELFPEIAEISPSVRELTVS